MQSDRPEIKCDLLIVGAGLAGASLARSLSSAPIHIIIVESASKIDLLREAGLKQKGVQTVERYSSRVSALTEGSLQFLKKIGVWNEVDRSAYQPYQKMYVWDALGSRSVEFDARDIHQPSLGHIVENVAMLAALHAQLEAQSNVEVLWEQQFALSNNGDPVTSPRQQIDLLERGLVEPGLIVGADGALSGVRRLFGFETREWDYGHTAITATVQTENTHAHTAWQRFSEDGPLAFLPLHDEGGEGCFCSIVWSLQTDRATELLTLEEHEFMQELGNAIEHKLGKVVAVSKPCSFPLRQRHAKEYVKPGVVLVADAAHTIHPLAGQGLNLGFKDVEVLSEVLSEACSEGLTLDNTLLLKRYQRKRQVANLGMMALMEGFKRLFETQDPLIRLLRNAGMDWVDRQVLLKKQIVRRAMDLSAL